MTLNSISYCGVCGHFSHSGFQCEYQYPLSQLTGNPNLTSTVRCTCMIRDKAVSRNFAKIAKLVKAYRQSPEGQMAHWFGEAVPDYCGGCGHRKRDHSIDTVTDSSITGEVVYQTTVIRCFADGCEPTRYSYQLVR